MRNDQIFVLMLVVLLPMSGCFDGGGVGEAEGQVEPGDSIPQGSSETTTNHYYYNNTTTIQPSSNYKYVAFDQEISNGQVNSSNGQWNSTLIPMHSNFNDEYEHAYLGSFNTTQNNLYTVVYSVATCETVSGWGSEGSVSCRVMIESTCGEISYSNIYYAYSTSETAVRMMSGTVASSCTHTAYSYYPIILLEELEVISLHYEIAFKETPVTAL